MKTQTRIAKTTFVALVKRHGASTRPAYTKLADALGITLIEERKCECGKKFLPSRSHQTHCTGRCGALHRQWRYDSRKRLKAGR